MTEGHRHLRSSTSRECIPEKLLPGDMTSDLSLIDEQRARIQLRQRWELAFVLNFFRIFRPLIPKDLKIPAEEIETALIAANKNLGRIHIALLKGIPPIDKRMTNPDAWITSVCKKLATWWSWIAEGEIPLRTDHGKEIALYKQLDPTTRLLILKALCDVRAEQDDILEFIADELKKGNTVGSFRKERMEVGNSGARPGIVVRDSVHILPRDMLGQSTFWSLNMSAQVVTYRNGRSSAKLAKIKSGDIKVFSAVKRLTAKGAEFVDGRSQDFDAVILVTGYKSNLPSWLKEGKGTSSQRKMVCLGGPFPMEGRGREGIVIWRRRAIHCKLIQVVGVFRRPAIRYTRGFACMRILVRVVPARREYCMCMFENSRSGSSSPAKIFTCLKVLVRVVPV